MKVLITIDTNSPAFITRGGAVEVSRILRNYAATTSKLGIVPGTRIQLVDHDGNPCGTVEITQ